MKIILLVWFQLASAPLRWEIATDYPEDGLSFDSFGAAGTPSCQELVRNAWDKLHQHIAPKGGVVAVRGACEVEL